MWIISDDASAGDRDSADDGKCRNNTEYRPITSDRLTSDAVRQTIAENPLVGEGIDPTPVHGILGTMP